ncbi:hypothetical protein M434DRAFT_13866 [Hypoxylon sp. CO27-5]|nr:hypothetical protein M434DRAFT_13866 [Hypoxylon sp. CO27-5]
MDEIKESANQPTNRPFFILHDYLSTLERRITMQQIRRTFLDIPANIRERIYLYAGLISGANIQLRKGRPLFTWIPNQWFSLTYNLLQTCKAIYAQIKSILYARNSIVICHEYVEAGLQILRSLSPEQCRRLRHVYVHLHVNGTLDDLVGTHEIPYTTLSFKQIVAWQGTARHILSHVEPGTLELHIISDTGDSQETRAICEPLVEFPGKLKNCELRLSSRRQNHLSALALETVKRIQGGDPASWNTPFRFLDLPFEIRRQILEYTDLVTPYNQVQWNAKKGFHTVFYLSSCALEDCPPEYHHACKVRFCMRADHYETGSFCRSRRSAYSSSCHCWSPPGALMLVSRAVYQDAIDVLYSHNRIIAMPSRGLNTSVCSRYSLSRLDASRFITRHMWPGVLRHLRSLELVFPIQDEPSCPETSSPLYLDWCFAIHHLKVHANITQLTVIVHTEVAPLDFEGDYWPPIPLDWTPESTLKTQARLLAPLQALRQMKHFFVFVGWRWHWTPRCLEYGLDDLDIDDKIAIEIEEWLEQFVMGDGYRSSVTAKAKQIKSDWIKMDQSQSMYL